VAFVSRALPSRPVVPVLSGMLVDAGQDGLTLSCFDYEVSARIRIDAEIIEPGSALVPGRLLAEITRSLPARPAEFSEEPGVVNLTCGSAEFGLVCLPAEDYPALPESPEPVGVVEGGLLASAVARAGMTRCRCSRRCAWMSAGLCSLWWPPTGTGWRPVR
jgi:DNA polymerase-3 subunit beta